MDWNLIVHIITVLVPVLGALWFIAKKSYDFGSFKSSTEDSITSIKDKLKDINDRIAKIEDNGQRTLNTLAEMRIALAVLERDRSEDEYSHKNSPRQLNERGRKIYEECNGDDFLTRNKERLFALIGSRMPQTKLDVETYARAAMVALSCEPAFNNIKDFIYDHAAIEIDGQQREITLQDICFILSLPLRDMYITEVFNK